VCPGGTITPYHIRRAASQGVSEAELRAQRKDANLLGRWAEPREVAFAILFLACDESSFVTGATLMVDAGKSIL
jgi:meso-butanediol dehydrogenase/(S,S)-butanediol dehydrogenase/diacetyl reductase